MAKNALIILAEGFEEIEAVAVIDILRRAGIPLTIAAVKGNQVKSARGILITADKNLDEITGNFDAVILPGGGSGAKNLAESSKVAALIKSTYQSGNIIAAICASPSVVVAPTGILANKSVTGYPGMLKGFDQTTKYLDQPVVVDGTIITSRGPATAMSFGFAIVEQLAGKAAADKLRSAMLAL